MIDIPHQSAEDKKNLEAWQDFENKYPFLQDVPDRPIPKPSKMTNDNFIKLLKDRNVLAKNFYLKWLETILKSYKGADLETTIKKWQSNIMSNAPIDVEIEIASALTEMAKEFQDSSKTIIVNVARNLVLDLQNQWRNLILESPDYEGFQIIETVAPVKKKKDGTITKLKPSEKKLKTLSVKLRADVTLGSKSFNLLKSLSNSKTWMEPINKALAELEKSLPSAHQIELDRLLNVLDILENAKRQEFQQAVLQDPKMLDNFQTYFPLILSEFPGETVKNIASQVWVYELDTGIPTKGVATDFLDHIYQVFVEHQQIVKETKQIQIYRDQLDQVLSREVDLPMPRDQKVETYIVTNITWLDTRNFKTMDQLSEKHVETWSKEVKLDTSKFNPKTTVLLTVIPQHGQTSLKPIEIPLELVQIKNQGYVLTQPFHRGAVFPQTIFTPNLKLMLQSIRFIMHEKGWLPDSPWIIFQKWFVNEYEPNIERQALYIQEDIEDSEDESDYEGYESDDKEFEEQQRAADRAFIEQVETEDFCSFYIKEVASTKKRK